ncbi:MAG TPA: hypothetical protein VMZ49_11985 [Patescibacteria group bacterium]|nr:hypothetical protein [Patescibacteria group bacterium]
MKKLMFIFFGGLLAIGFAGYFVFSGQWLRYVFAHLGGLGIMGFLGLLAGTIAAHKGYSFKRAFLLGFALPTLLGIIAVAIVHLSGGRGCGGIVSLAGAFLVIILYCFAKNKNAGKPSGL